MHAKSSCAAVISGSSVQVDSLAAETTRGRFSSTISLKHELRSDLRVRIYLYFFYYLGEQLCGVWKTRINGSAYAK